MHLSQLKNGGVVCRIEAEARLIQGATSIFDLALEAVNQRVSLANIISLHGLGSRVDLPALAADKALDCPVRHPDPAHMFLTGTGLTHLGSASARDAMHAKSNTAEASENLTDSMKMFQMGIKGGKPTGEGEGVQPEWFYKGTGKSAVATGDPLVSPSFALDGGEEPEIAGFYIIGQDGAPHRIGFTLANEFSDHVTERINYLYLAHSKLRNASFGPEILIGELPKDIRGSSRIVRAGDVIWEKTFLSGEANMSHSLRNLEHHHFKYPIFREPGDLHVHMFGTATLSFADGIETKAGDIFEISAPEFGLALSNPIVQGEKLSTRVVAL